MMKYTFILKYQLADHDCNPVALVERLGEAGFDDALVGIGQPGRLAQELTCEASDADEAVRSALACVRRTVPSARLIEVAPDLVGLTDVAKEGGGFRVQCPRSWKPWLDERRSRPEADAHLTRH
ncbi:hypothetical protein [Halotalea alkalilenta]|uniref:hypothetical protein n=1 Tax=Halotalea alkalilenta TaxID=376489 RepID=UPI000AC7390B|nr:hypothetical protein [Halotalea alkalilenta]